MLAIALRHVPHACCLVPEKREERTTEGGLDVARGREPSAPRRRAAEGAPASACRCSSSPRPTPSRRPRGSARRWSSCTPAPIASARSRTTPAACSASWPGCERAAHGRGRGRPRGARRARAHLQHGRRRCAHPGDRRAQHRPLPDRRGDLRRPRTGHRPHARADGRGPGRRRRGQAQRKGRRDPRPRQRHHRHPPHREGPRRATASASWRVSSPPRSARNRTAGPAAPPPTPSASPPRRPAQRRWAPGSGKGVFWRDMGVVNLRSGRPTMVLTGGAAEQLKRITPAGPRGPRRPLADRRLPAGPGHRRHLGRAGRRAPARAETASTRP